jgi:CTP:molybdopterin cytidylyltransferase MocA
VPEEIVIGKNNTAVVILAAGFSSRMQAPKPLLPFDNQQVFLEKILAEYRSWGCGEMVVVMNEAIGNWVDSFHKRWKNVGFVLNRHPELGRFHSLRLGLNELKQAEYCFIQNVDNPFVNQDLLDQLFMKRGENHFVKPVHQQKGGHPILINKMDMAFLKAQEDTDTNLRELLAKRECLEMEVDDPDILININTYEDYQQTIKNR